MPIKKEMVRASVNQKMHVLHAVREALLMSINEGCPVEFELDGELIKINALKIVVSLIPKSFFKSWSVDKSQS